MPYYDLKCKNCGHEFNFKATIEMRVKNMIPCPECGNGDLESVFKALNYSVRKSVQDAPSCPHAHQCGCNCRH